MTHSDNLVRIPKINFHMDCNTCQGAARSCDQNYQPHLPTKIIDGDLNTTLGEIVEYGTSTVGTCLDFDT